jgi:hypothetical protein
MREGCVRFFQKRLQRGDEKRMKNFAEKFGVPEN